MWTETVIRQHNNESEVEEKLYLFGIEEKPGSDSEAARMKSNCCFDIQLVQLGSSNSSMGGLSYLSVVSCFCCPIQSEASTQSLRRQGP
jgi:hypothetical protein